MLLYFDLGGRVGENLLTRNKKSLELLYDNTTPEICLKFSRSMLYILCVEAQTRAPVSSHTKHIQYEMSRVILKGTKNVCL